MREIAEQSGLSEATVDRVLNRRGMVRPSTAEQVTQAIADLQRQRSQLQLGGRTFMVDVVVQAPERFSGAVRAALEEELPSLRPAVIRSRFHLRESGDPAELIAVLDRIADRRSHGVILKAPDLPGVAAAAARLSRAGVPVVTLVTDLPGSERVAYVGMDNRAAGATAAYLLGRWVGREPGSVLVSVSSAYFRGEEERETGFRGAMRELYPGRALVDIAETDGLDDALRIRVGAALASHPDIVAVYSIGGGNVATVEAFEAAGRHCAAFVGHDLDPDNRRLLRDGRISAVLHHDLRQDMRRACQIIMQAHRALPGPLRTAPSPVQIITPFNVP
ncbi:MAG TPA: LacI family DNA-binding transcriptional regulator [Mycobacteriales bacterium]|nr:LacI family DNA-binding transcriptional regulator [Mycobacteriales bacterium]